MVGDAEAHAEEDKKFRELVEIRNRADAMLHSVEKALKDLGDKVSGEDRAKAESAMADLRGVQKGDDGEVIAKKTEALATAAAGIAQQAYAAGQGGAGDAGGADAGAGAAGAGDATGGDKDHVVDAEFEEVKDKDKGQRAS
jgi:molecular chaperone DnaK